MPPKLQLTVQSYILAGMRGHLLPHISAAIWKLGYWTYNRISSYVIHATISFDLLQCHCSLAVFPFNYQNQKKTTTHWHFYYTYRENSHTHRMKVVLFTVKRTHDHGNNLTFDLHTNNCNQHCCFLFSLCPYLRKKPSMRPTTEKATA